MATLDTLLDFPLYGALTSAIESTIADFESEGFDADDVAAAGVPDGLEFEVYLIGDLPEHEQDDGAEMARAELARIWADEVRAFASTRLARAA